MLCIMNIQSGLSFRRQPALCFDASKHHFSVAVLPTSQGTVIFTVATVLVTVGDAA
jgi:hypothetical protein